MEGAEHETILCETLFSKFRRALLHKLDHTRSEHRYQTSNNNGKQISVSIKNNERIVLNTRSFSNFNHFNFARLLSHGPVLE